jgi:small ligand-binding sensory domain FIST
VIAASALSEHPVAAHAVGEVAGTILEQIQDDIDLLVVFIDSAHTGAVEDISSALLELLRPGVMIGATACGVIERTIEVEDRHALAVWAMAGVHAQPLRVDAGRISPLGGWNAASGDHAILLADPFSCPVLDVLAEARDCAPRLRLHGGLASGARGPGGNRLLLDDQIHADGAVGIALAGANVTSIVSQGCRPVGAPFTVTGVAGHVITELASQRPMDVLNQVASTASDEERSLLSAGVHVGIVIDESLPEFEPGDFLIRSVMGADAESGAIAIGAEVQVGTTLQFQVRDASTASEDLMTLLSDETATAALTFTCNGRGENLFGRPGHDAELVHELTGSSATSGMFCVGELGPIGTENHLHGFTASTLLFH